MKTYPAISFSICLILAVAACDSKKSAERQRGLAVMDSLKIADPDEKKVCAEFDDNVTDFIGQIEIAAADSAHFKNSQGDAMEKEFGAKMDTLNTKLNGIKRRVSKDFIEKKKIEDFATYEIQRLFAVAAKYNKTK